MNASTMLLALALTGQCRSGYCPRPIAPAWSWTYPTMPAVPVAQVQATPGPTSQPAPNAYDIEENGTKLKVWGTPRYDAEARKWSIDWDRDNQPTGYPMVLNRPAAPKGAATAGVGSTGSTGTALNFGVDLSHEKETAAIESTDPNIASILTPPEAEKPPVQVAGLPPGTVKDQPEAGGWLKNPFKPDPIDTTTPALIVGAALLLGFLLMARSRSSEEC